MHHPSVIPRVRFAAAALVLAAALLAAPSPALAVRKLALSSGKITFSLAAGQQASGQVIVSNDGDQPLHVMVYASDQSVDDTGNVTYQTPTRSDLQSLVLPSSWATIKMPPNSKSLGNIPYLELAPGQRIPVKFSFFVPAGVAPGDHNVIIFFESFEPPKIGSNTQSMVLGRLGARVTLRVQGTFVRKLEVRPYVVPQWVIGDSVPYSFVVRNLGNLDQRVGARIRLFDRSDNEVARQTAIDGVTVFAGTNLARSGTISARSAFPVGQFKVRLDVSPVDDAGKATNSGADTITEDRTVWLVPMWLIIAVIVLLVALVVALIWILVARSRRKRLREADEAYRRGREHAADSASDADEPADSRTREW